MPSSRSASNQGKSSHTTFAVSDVAPATTPLPVVPYHQAVTEFLGGQVESCSRYYGQLVSGVRMHPLVETLHRAFATHRPISLSPDIIWLTLTQGFAHHVNAQAEELRHLFVQHEGKLQLIVRRDDFIKGSPENLWPEVFNEFSQAIQRHIGDVHELIVADFSTTGPIERAASEIVLLDAMQAYFTYEVHTLCGIPSITLEGTPEDWQAIADRVGEFRRFGLDWWIDALIPLLYQFVAAARGSVDREFWDSIYKWHGNLGSGKEPYITGWILNFFPYLTRLLPDHPQANGPVPASSFKPNLWITQEATTGRGPTPDRIPCYPARAPFVWKYSRPKTLSEFFAPKVKDYSMEFVGGLIGIQQDPQTLCLRPEIGWVVWEVGAEDRKRQADEEARARARQAAHAAAIKSANETNRDANRQFNDARQLGRRIFEMYQSARSANPARGKLDDSEQNRWLVELVNGAYAADSAFQQAWNNVHGEPPSATHYNWIVLWKRT